MMGIGNVMPGMLYIVGTPIGNLEDITFRAVRVLREVDAIAAEDTRVTAKLLAHYAIAARAISYHRHSGAGRLEQILSWLRKGKSVALVSDAGMPGISDPGQALIAACVAEGIPVTPIPGPSSVISALAVSGFNTDSFAFLGFLPRARKERVAILRASLSQPATSAAFEAPHRLGDTLGDIVQLAPAHPLLIAREVTKKFEELIRGPAVELAARYASETARGEIVLVWPGSGITAPVEDHTAQALALAKGYRTQGLSARDAATRAAAETGVARRVIYQGLIG